MSSDIAISVQNVSKIFRLYKRPQDRLLQRFTRKPLFNEFHALSHVSFDVRKGETVGIVGRNGSGKSTLLQLICGTLTPSSGHIKVNGRVAALLELGAGFNPEFTGRENVYLNGTILGLTRAQIDERLDKIFAFAEIGDFIDQPVKTYSSGMYVRLAFAVIAHVDADILIIDEALAVGDALFTQKCMRFLRKFRETGTILFVSHDSHAVTNLCQHAVWLQRGKVIEQGAAKDVSEAYLASLFESTNTTTKKDEQPQTIVAKREEWVDQRQSFINASNLRNDLEIFKFDADAKGFGTQHARITNVRLTDAEGRSLAWVVGGEVVTLAVTAECGMYLDRPIIGFYVKDRLGQTLFGDNTYLGYQHKPVDAESGATLTASFRFPMPWLPVGDYSIAVAIANGTQSEHVQHHWLHDALIFRSHSSAAATGLVGIPMLDIQLERV